MVQIILEREIRGIVERRFDAIPHVTRIDEVLGRDSGVYIRNREFGNLDNTILNFGLVELEYRRQRIHVERCHYFRRNPYDERIAFFVHRYGNMIVEHRRETHTACNGADALQKFLCRRFVGRRCTQIVTVQATHTGICFGEHLNHDVHFIVIVRAVRLGDGSLEQFVITITISRESTLQLVLRPAELITSRFAYRKEPLNELGFLKLEKCFIIDLVGMRLQVLHRYPTFGITPLCSGFLEHGKRVFEQLRLDVGSHESVEQTRELIEQIMVHGVEQCRYVIRIARNSRVGNSLLIII